MKKSRHSRDQKRKAKLKRRESRAPATDITPYLGTKYRKDKYVDITFATEAGILETYVVTHRRLTDEDVIVVVEGLIGKLRSGQLSFPPADDPAQFDSTDVRDFMAWNIGSRWRELAEDGIRVSTKDLVGVLRSLLGSIEVWGSPSKGPRGYLDYLEDFMKNLGYVVETVGNDSLPFASVTTQPVQPGRFAGAVGLIGRMFMSARGGTAN